MEKRDGLPAGRQGFFKHQLKSFNFAIEGIIFSFKSGLHFKFHILALIMVIIFGLYFSISQFEWLVIILISSAVISAEAMNTALEQTCNVLHPEDHPVVRLAKHCAAGGVLILSVAAILIGLIIFIPKIFG
ncbi:hypothetical protein A3F02_02535 [Candidatus Curtissbacteria bacterium RIFCSPHIGHO2_12_FULL_38_9b]|uniref:Diacylglycerol kinase n=2 Tax=Candidatus Curtissiibacteriota TaxID=1752717 RepID=A0A1F5GUM3_9BACT|nr:MAG: hypothetical protein A3A48_02550 [Candidatus Curtissbacteria bacterium RIFCSPLOWO2_01_FULL_37_9]OGD95576.1 MAG: hypothetical protein A3F02_02535 [Candidatus Curtissbacteria bacterium RIFCSPHIGHO2_12_FULL_38_9b]